MKVLFHRFRIISHVGLFVPPTPPRQPGTQNLDKFNLWWKWPFEGFLCQFSCHKIKVSSERVVMLKKCLENPLRFFGTIVGHISQILIHFEPFLIILGYFWRFLGHAKNPNMWGSKWDQGEQGWVNEMSRGVKGGKKGSKEGPNWVQMALE